MARDDSAAAEFPARGAIDGPGRRAYSCGWMAAAAKTRTRRNSYFDSVVLMRIAAALVARPGVEDASLMMGTPANKEILRAAGLLDAGGEAAGPNDLVIAVRAEAEIADGVLDGAEAGLSAQPSAGGEATSRRPRSLAQAAAQLEGADLALISTPGAYAAAEALKALKLGMHVFLFSDNVSIEDELALKEEAGRRGLLVMGPDCGTAIVNGVPLGFANAVQRGDVGLIGASGTGSQEISCLIDAAGAGISQLIGVGSHDLSEKIGARSMLFAFDALDADPRTRVIVLVSKPPAPAVAGKVLERAARSSKPVVVNFIGSRLESSSANVHPAATLDEAARFAAGLSLGRAVGAPAAQDVADRPGAGRAAIRALFSGGTFAYEAGLLLGDVNTSIGSWAGGHPIAFPPGHLVLDLGGDEFTLGRPHPMIDPTLRVEFLRAALRAPDTAVVLLDVVLGTGSADDPAGALAPAIQEAAGGPVVIAFVCGTAADSQGLAAQQRKLTEAGAVLAPSSTAAVRLAGDLVGARV
jgi:FdrA protein